MRRLETDKLLVVDRTYRYEFAQPIDDGKLYAADTTFGKIRASNWEPYIYMRMTARILAAQRGAGRLASRQCLPRRRRV
jgi:hypothetical protein